MTPLWTTTTSLIRNRYQHWRNVRNQLQHVEDILQKEEYNHPHIKIICEYAENGNLEGVKIYCQQLINYIYDERLKGEENDG